MIKFDKASWNNKRVPFSALVGKRITKIDVYDDEIIFTCDNGQKYHQYHEQDCCESVSIESIDGELLSFVGNIIVQADEETKDGDKTDYGSSTWTFYRIADDKGNYSVIRWFGESNGYYSEGVSFAIEEP